MKNSYGNNIYYNRGNSSLGEVSSIGKLSTGITAPLPINAQSVLDIDILKETQTNYRDKTKQDIRIGILAPFSGEYEQLGLEIKNTAMMGLYEISSSKVILQFYDTLGTPEGARIAIKEAIKQQVDIVIGPVFSSEVKAIRDIAIRENIEVLAFTSDPSVLGKGIYTLALLLPQQIERIVKYACGVGKKNIAIITQDNTFGELVVNSAISSSYKCDNGAQISNVAYFSPKEGDMISVIKSIAGDRSTFVDATRRKQKQEGEYGADYKLEEGEEEEIDFLSVYSSSWQIPLDFDALIIADEGANLRSLSAVLNYYDITSEEVMFLGTQQWSDSKLSQEKGLLGGIYPEIPVSGFIEFAKRYKDIYKTVPPRIASQVYDGIALVSLLANNKDFSREALTDASGFSGVDGIFRLNSNGRSERGLSIMRISHPQSIVLESAPATFADFPIKERATRRDNFSKGQRHQQQIEEDMLNDYTINIYKEQPTSRYNDIYHLDNTVQESLNQLR